MCICFIDYVFIILHISFFIPIQGCEIELHKICSGTKVFQNMLEWSRIKAHVSGDKIREKTVNCRLLCALGLEPNPAAKRHKHAF